MQCRLVQAKATDRNDRDIYEMLQDIDKNENGFENGAYGLRPGEFDQYILGLIEGADLGKVKQGRVPQTVFWLYDNDRIIGFSKMRHFLNEGLRLKGGHIGYGIRKSMRGQGYGNKILELTLEKINALGVTKVLITCNSTNVASRRVIEKNGGTLASIIENECAYWISKNKGDESCCYMKMSAPEYSVIRSQMIEELAKAQVETGAVAEGDAKASAEEEQDSLLPAGVETADHWLNSLKTETGEHIGYSWFGKVEREYGLVVFIFDVNVFPEYRGRGYGHRLMKEIEKEAQRNGFKEIELYGLNSNTTAKALYSKEGYQIIRGNEKGIVLSKSMV